MNLAAGEARYRLERTDRPQSSPGHGIPCSGSRGGRLAWASRALRGRTDTKRALSAEIGASVRRLFGTMCNIAPCLKRFVALPGQFPFQIAGKSSVVVFLP
jgi:hypothetical protein